MEIAVGDVVQIDPSHDSRFGGCLMVVTEVKSWGAQGYVLVPDAGSTMRSYYRCPNEKMVKIGKVEWMLTDEDSR